MSLIKSLNEILKPLAVLKETEETGAPRVNVDPNKYFDLTREEIREKLDSLVLLVQEETKVSVQNSA